MATKKPNPFAKFGKESMKEERMEKKMSPKAYKAMEKKEGIHKMKSGGAVKGKRGC